MSIKPPSPPGKAPVYDTIGINYSELRRPDPRIQAAIDRALGDAASVLNVGAGTGSYEPQDRSVTALEPSSEMIRQRTKDAAPIVQGIAESLPFDDNAFDAAMAVLTIHHWSDQAKGLQEMRRVARDRVIILTFDPEFQNFWLADYIPALFALDQKTAPTLQAIAAEIGHCEIVTIPIPHDCADGFLCAYWRRPEFYLDPRIRAAISSFSMIGDIDEPLGRLDRDIQSGEWARRYAGLLDQPAHDFGYRLLISRE